MSKYPNKENAMNILNRVLNKIGSSKNHRSTAEPKGLVVFPGQLNDVHKALRRTEAIAEQLVQAGISDISLMVPASLQLPDSFSAKYEIATSDHWADICKGRITALIPVDQYHVSHEWISDLVRRANESDTTHTHENLNSPLIGHLRLRCGFLVTSRSASRKLIAAAGSGKLNLLAPKGWFQRHMASIREVPLVASNVASFYRQASKFDLPCTFVVETNSSCNYHCLMCPYHGGRQKKKPTFLKPGTYVDMPLETFKRVIDEIAAVERLYEDDTPTLVSPYRRGELLLYPHWREALAYIKGKPNLRAYFSSNGSLWTDSDIDFILDIGLDHLQISIEGHDLETHQRIRLNDEFTKVANTIRNVIQKRESRGVDYPLVQLAHTVNERNYELVDDYVKFWLNKVDALFLGPENYADDESFNKRYKTDFSPVLPKPDSFRPPCSMVKDNIWIDAEGTVILCIGSKQTIIGNVNKQSITEIINAPIRLEVMNNHAAGNYTKGVCGNCAQWYSAYGETKESDSYSAFMSPDTQYYKRKKPVEMGW